MKRSVILPGLVAVLVAVSPAGVALADNPHNAGDNPNSTGQPNQEAGSPASPVSPPGFSSGGFANAETRYANPDSTGGTSSGNPHVVSQYDVAAFQISNNHGHTK